MVPGSKVVTGLNSGDPTPGRTRYDTADTSRDGAMNPDTNTPVDTATNVQVRP
ncbi:hypothetical protein V3N99_05625 [Dermatophilaceae bacterium Soc4.6]